MPDYSSNAHLTLLYLISLYFTGFDTLFLLQSPSSMRSSVCVCVSGFGVEWPEGGSSINVTQRKEARRQTMPPLFSRTDPLWRVPLLSHLTVFISIVVTGSSHWLRNMASLLQLHLFASGVHRAALITDLHSHCNSKSTAHFFFYKGSRWFRLFCTKSIKLHLNLNSHWDSLKRFHGFVLLEILWWK